MPLRAELGEVTRDRFATAYSGKFTWQVNALNRLDFSVFGDPSHGDMGPQRRTALTRTDTAAFSEIDYGGHNRTVRYEGVLGSNWLLTGSVAHASNLIEETPLVDAYSILDSTGPVNVRRGGVGFYVNQLADGQDSGSWGGHGVAGIEILLPTRRSRWIVGGELQLHLFGEPRGARPETIPILAGHASLVVKYRLP